MKPGPDSSQAATTSSGGQAATTAAASSRGLAPVRRARAKLPLAWKSAWSERRSWGSTPSARLGSASMARRSLRSSWSFREVISVIAAGAG